MRVNPKLQVARRLRRQPTDAEALLWYRLRNRALAGLKFRRQVPVGPYIADFLCRAQLLVVEADGGQHALPGVDARRDAFLRACGFRVLRFWDNDILLRPDHVCDAILAACSPDTCDSPPASLDRKTREG